MAHAVRRPAAMAQAARIPWFGAAILYVPANAVRTMGSRDCNGVSAGKRLAMRPRPARHVTVLARCILCGRASRCRQAAMR